jgi:hypothetical protein
MKLLLENWREYLKERIDYLPPKEQEEFDLGRTFDTITKLDIIESPSENVHQKNSLLNLFGTLQNTTNTIPEDGVTIKNILASIYSYSGNSDKFNYISKEEALHDYLDPFRYNDKSLKDYHQHIQDIVYNLTRHK